MKLPTCFPIVVQGDVSETEFIKFWSSQFEDPRAQLYKTNIDRPLTPKRILALFKWKNGGTIAMHKLASIQRNYINTKPIPPAMGNREALLSFIAQPGGAIWRIFWLHCHDPASYPIFDQHVYRAMKRLLDGQPSEIPASNRAKAIVYIDEYLPFNALFRNKDRKTVDEALWLYGKRLKNGNAF